MRVGPCVVTLCLVLSPLARAGIPTEEQEAIVDDSLRNAMQKAPAERVQAVVEMFRIYHYDVPGGLVRLGVTAEMALPFLRAAMKDADPQVREAAVLALVAPQAPIPSRASTGEMLRTLKLIPDLIERLRKDESSSVRAESAEALMAFGPDAAPALDALRNGLADSSPGVRWRCADALGAMGQRAAAAIPDLVKAADEPVPPQSRAGALFQSAVRRALARIRSAAH